MSHAKSAAISPSIGPFPNAPTTALCARSHRALAREISVRRIVKGPCGLSPLNRSLGSKSANHRGGITHVSVRMCGIRSSSSSLPRVRASSCEGERKNFVIDEGRLSLNESRAAQHRIAVDQGATNLSSPTSMTCAPSALKEGDSGLIVRASARNCSSRLVEREPGIAFHRS